LIELVDQAIVRGVSNHDKGVGYIGGRDAEKLEVAVGNHWAEAFYAKSLPQQHGGIVADGHTARGAVVEGRQVINVAVGS
jgi:hypothetical protein